MIPISQVCGDCKIDKLAAEFPLRKKGGGRWVWLRLQCKACMNARRKLEYPKNAEKIKKRNSEYAKLNAAKTARDHAEWRKNNPEKIKAKLESNKEKIKDQRIARYNKNPKKFCEAVREYSKKNRDKINIRMKRVHAAKNKVDLTYTLTRLLRGRIASAIRDKAVKSKRTMELTGCDMPTLLSHIENLFTDGMNWTNMGMKGWHIDHKVPCSSFDMTDVEQQKICFNYKNLQPLWWYVNLTKGNKISEEYGNK